MYDSNHLAHHLREASKNNNQKIFAYLTQSMPVSYGALFENAERIASALVLAGVNPGDRVAMQVGKSLQAIELYLGTIMAGGVFLPLNTDYTANEVDYFLSDASPTVFVCAPEKYSDLVTVAKKASVKSLLTLSEDGLKGSLIDVAAEQKPGFEAVARGENDLAAILYTSGTTGRSKGAMLTHRALASNALTLKEYWHFSQEDCLLHALPIFHIHGLFVAINITLVAGSSLIYLDRFDAHQMLENIPKATVMMGVPTFYTRLLDQRELTKSVTSNMRLFVSGSAPMLVDTHQQWTERTGHKILERYGMTETNMNTSNPYDGERKIGTVGLPLPGVELRISDLDTGEILVGGQVGQIEIKGANVFAGYWNMPEKTAEELSEDGWFKTGDLGTKDGDGYVTIVGRSKDMIISGGYNVYPKEIESVIDDLDGVSETAVIGVPHKDFGEGVVAIVVPEAGSLIDAQAVIAHSRLTLAKFKLPKQVVVLDALPRNRMGKVQKAILREQYKELLSN